jgi:hypothetical protein
VWATASETNASHFDIYRSFDGQNFTHLTSIVAAGNSSTQQDYSYIDDVFEEKAYYKLTQTDFDGHIHQLGMVVSECYSEEKYTLYPNPSYAEVNLLYSHPSESKIVVVITDSRGAIVLKSQFEMNPSGGICNISNGLQLEPSDYQVQIFGISGRELFSGGLVVIQK